jgi:Fe-S cluster assembly ATP-binding protein
MGENFLEIVDLSVNIEDKVVFEKLNLKINLNEINVLLGPNGAGKSTLANVIMGDSRYQIVSGKIYFRGEDITDLDTAQRAKKGLFLSFQHPEEIEGVNVMNFLRISYNVLTGKDLSVGEFVEVLDEKMDELGFSDKFKSRSLNVGFSGGEKKKGEILQLLLYEPNFAILDEIDSGLDVDALKLVGQSLKKLHYKKEMGMLIITHYNKILDFLTPQSVFVLKKNGEVVRGGLELIERIEREGFC